MKELVQWCLELGIACVSVYAFSIDNFTLLAGMMTNTSEK
jgi:undecaprenyl diphosphate synthase